MDVTVTEIAEEFKKGGVFLLDPMTTLPKIKLYLNSNNEFEGNALVIYLREESVPLACQLIDETSFRQNNDTLIRVQPAVFKDKGEPEKVDEDKIDKKTKHRIFQKMNRLVTSS